MNRWTKRLSCAILALALALAALPAFAASTYKGYVSANTTQVYAQPNVLSKSLGTVSYGESLNVLAWRDGWARVKNGSGKIGYCKLSTLSAKDNNTLDMDGWVREDGAHVRNRPSSSGKSIATVKAGTKLRAVAITKDKKWVRVRSGKKYGYIASGDLSRTPVSTSSAQRVWIVSDGAVNVYRSQSATSAMGTVSHGQSFELVRTEGKRACIRANGKTAWVAKDVLSKKDPNTLNQTAYAQVSGKALYGNALLRNAKASLRRDEKLTVVSVSKNGKWSRVRKGKNYYYVLSLLLDDEKAPEDGRVLTCAKDVALYSDAKLSGTPIATVKADDFVRLTGVSGAALKLETSDGTVGYCSCDGWRAV